LFIIYSARKHPAIDRPFQHVVDSLEQFAHFWAASDVLDGPSLHELVHLTENRQNAGLNLIEPRPQVH
jgi:hypothetical protein